MCGCPCHRVTAALVYDGHSVVVVLDELESSTDTAYFVKNVQKCGSF